MIYLDTSVALAHLLAEDRSPPENLGTSILISSRLLEYEIWTRIHARKLGRSHADEVRSLFGTGRLGRTRSARTRLAPWSRFQFPVRTLDALHLAAIDFLQQTRSKRCPRKLRRPNDRRRPRAAVYSLRVLSPCASLRQNRQSEI